METPKDHLKKPDWLDKASQPSDGWRVAMWIVVILLLAGGGAALILSGLLF